VNLAPADLAQGFRALRSAHCTGHPGRQRPDRRRAAGGHEFAGELSLSGELRPVRGALAMSLALHRQQVSTRLVLPPAAPKRPRWCPTRRSTAARHLLDVVRQFLPGQPRLKTPTADDGWAAPAATPLPDGRALCRPGRRQGAGRRQSARWRSPPPAATACC
jgi:magnesium chelatase family protein